MNGKELRSFTNYQILTKISQPHLRRKSSNSLILMFVFIHCKAVKVSQNDEIRM